MTEEEDVFYQTLPFTISKEQSKPQYIILGTGLQECLIAAHESKMNEKMGLILDTQKAYGSSLKTITFKQLHSLTTNTVSQKLYKFIEIEKYKDKNNSFNESLIQKKAFRGYNIDIEPNYFFGSSITCQMLKDAEMDKYMDFRLVNNMLHYDGKGLKNVPLSKGKIFESKDLGLLEKKLLLNSFHSLIQIYNKYMNVEEDQNSTKQFDKDFGNVNEKLYEEFENQLDSSFVPWIQKLTKKNKKIMNYITYIICNYQHSFDREIPHYMKEQYTVKGFIKRFGKFVKSCGIYGQLPYLYVDNGIGDIPQAFSRIASIYGSTYILHPKLTLDSISVSDNEEDEYKIKIKSNLYPEGQIETKRLYYGPTLQNIKSQEGYEKQNSLRCILIAQKDGSQENCPSIAYFLDVEGFVNPIYLFMFDNQSHTCPQKYIIYQFQTIIGEENQAQIQQKVEKIMNMMKNIRGQKFQELLCYCSVYVREKRYPKQNKGNQGLQIHLKDHNGIDLDSHFLNFVKIVGEKQKYFRKKQPGQEEQEQEYANQTLGLIEKLNNIDLEKKQEEQVLEKDNENEQKPLQKEGQEAAEKVEEQQKEQQVKDIKQGQNVAEQKEGEVKQTEN